MGFVWDVRGALARELAVVGRVGERAVVVNISRGMGGILYSSHNLLNVINLYASYYLR